MVFIEKESKNLEQYLGKRTFTESARAAMTFILQNRKCADRRGILLPSYIGVSKIEGSGVFDPVCLTEINYAFYAVDEQLRPDLQMLEKQLSSGAFQLVFLIHYFGLPQVDVNDFVAMCRRYGAKVIEDCAHTVLGGLEGRRLGSYGDYAIFSIHKSISTNDGGFFIDNTGQVDCARMPKYLSISKSTLTKFADTDLRAVSSRRLENYHTVADWVLSIPQLKLMFHRVPHGAVPLNCPVFVSEARREALYFNLVKRGILTTALYHKLIPEITKEEFPQAHLVSSCILNLPTHPDISPADLVPYERSLREAVREVFSK
jgi:dTDP-4-amino-4,6-dideoxygalactose transaminase